jgi:hypothetical protein
MNDSLLLQQHQMIEALREQLTKAMKGWEETRKIAEAQSADIQQLCQITQILMSVMSEEDLKTATEKISDMERSQLH